MAACTILLISSSTSVHAQLLPLKRLPPVEARTCPVIEPPGLGAAVMPAVIDSLVTAGTGAAAAGDLTEARLLLRQASFLDPSDPMIAYRLARVMDELDEPGDAVLEYCRYLALVPDGDGASVVRTRVSELLEASAAERWREHAEAGIAAYRETRYEDAALAFTEALVERPGWADAYYNRGVTYLASGEPDRAFADLRRYLELDPEAADSAAVLTELDFLRGIILASQAPVQRAPASGIPEGFAPNLPAPGGVLLRGLVIPGLGQVSTGRAVLGVLVLGGAAGAAYYGLMEETAVQVVTDTDPFGNPYQYPAMVSERPNLAVGIGAAAAIAAVGAIESYLYASRQRRDYANSLARGLAESPVGLSLTHRPGGLSLGLTVPDPFR